MLKRVVLMSAVALSLAAIPAAGASAVGPGRPVSQPDHPAAFTMAVYGDAPYGTVQGDNAEFEATPAFIDSVNADPDVSSVVHVGDIHSGKQFCTKAYDQAVYRLWTHYADPLVYTPGDNEWSDCHKTGEAGGKYNATTGQIDYVLDPVTGEPAGYAKGDPRANLNLVRQIFFARPGHTLGSGTLKVVSQARAYDRAHPADAQFVENVMWQQRGVVFVSVNVPGGSNNDADPWYGTPTASQRQLSEATQRTAADVRWLAAAFRVANRERAAGVVIVSQADMWDLDGNTADHVANYEPIVASIASQTSTFGGPVLLFEGDSHIYRSDNPLVQAAPCTGDLNVCTYDAWNSHPHYDVTNFHRVVVHGSTFPLEWLKLTVDSDAHNATSPSTFGPFSWQRMPQP
jgi:hypothetical protein